MADEQDDRDDFTICWDELTMGTRRVPQPSDFQAQKGDLAIGTSSKRLLVLIKPDGRLQYGPEYTPDEAAEVFWEALARKRGDFEVRMAMVAAMENLLLSLGQADLTNEAAQHARTTTHTEQATAEAAQAQRRLERVVIQTIEFGRGLVGRSELAPRSAPTDAEFAVQFEELERRVKEETRFVSNIRQITRHPAYLRIIALGPRAVPLILESFRRETFHWSMALIALTGQNPIPEEMRGDMAQIRQRWLDWGIGEGLIPPEPDPLAESS
jgi:hypothetical protein